MNISFNLLTIEFIINNSVYGVSFCSITDWDDYKTRSLFEFSISHGDICLDLFFFHIIKRMW